MLFIFVCYFFLTLLKRSLHVQEFCPHGTLSQYLTKNHATVSWKKKIELLQEIAAGVLYLHSNSIIHRDLKAANVLVDADCHAKLSDFGISKRMASASNQTAYVGTSNYMAPEVTLGKAYDTQADVFSFGVLMYEVLTNNWVPYGQNEMNIEMRVAMDANYRPNLPLEMKTAKLNSSLGMCTALITRCWEHESANRPTMSSVLSSLNQIASLDNLQHGKDTELPDYI